MWAKGNSTNWSIISTDFLPAKEDTYYNYSLDVSAKDVNQLHSKVIYYDSNKKEIGSDFIFTGRDGTFNNSIVNILNVPHNTKHIKFQMWYTQILSEELLFSLSRHNCSHCVKGSLEKW